MANSSTYYLDGIDLSDATSVYIDVQLTTLASDGWYSNGVIAREQVSGVLQAEEVCGECATPCGGTISASGGTGVYLLDIGTGDSNQDVGAIIVRFDPVGVPDGIKAIFNGTTYNKVTSPVDGYHESTNENNLTFLGRTSSDCGTSGTTYTGLQVFEYDGSSFVDTGETRTVTVDPGDVSLGVDAPGNTLMVIPKTTATPSVVNFEILGPCSGTAWTISVDCPQVLTGFSSSSVAASSNDVCALSETNTYYNASLYNTPGTVGLYDLVFSDEYGSTPLAQGFYKASGSISGGNDWFEVDANGVVVSIGTCVETVTVAPILLVNGDCSTGDPIDPFDGKVWIESSWGGFIANGSGKLVVNNTAFFAEPPERYYDPTDTNVTISSESITSDTNGTISPDNNTGDGVYLVQNNSLNTVGSNNIKATVDSDPDPTLSDVTFELCP